MYLSNYKFFNNNIIRGILLKKYNIKNSLMIPKIHRINVIMELKDKEDNISLENFLALNILTYLVKNKSSCITHSVRYKLGQKHTFVFQAILRGNDLFSFLNFFILNSLFLVEKKQIDLKLHVNQLHKNLLLNVKELSFFSQLPAEYFKWDTGIKIEFSVFNKKEIEYSILDLFSFLNIFMNKSNLNFILNKKKFYNAIFSYKR